ncbi:MAG: prepilin-type N-terminal cleavage/methylation domain-containing protein [Candidatus Omnitrophica bacterium]|nr:prepilin-type N-terminal cleavage/methylation domain-containing protein [Candidatus Omnitrophota bacterium]
MKKGFTLLEVLIAIIIVVVGVTAITWAFSKGIYLTTDIENVEGALNTAQLKLEEVFAELKDMDLTVLSPGNANNYESRKSETISVYTVSVDLHQSDLDLTASQNLMQVDVTVTWDVKGGEASTVFTTLVADY